MIKLVGNINGSNESTENNKAKWELLTYEIQKFTIPYSKTTAKIEKP